MGCGVHQLLSQRCVLEFLLIECVPHGETVVLQAILGLNLPNKRNEHEHRPPPVAVRRC